VLEKKPKICRYGHKTIKYCRFLTITITIKAGTGDYMMLLVASLNT